MMSESSLVPSSIYIYEPNKGAAIFFAAAFAVSGVLHLWQCIYYKCFGITVLLPFYSVLLVAGFAVRAYGAFHYDDAQVYTASTLLIYLAPPVLELANFQILGRIFHFVPYFALMHPGRLLITFASLCVIVELLTALGVSYLANRDIADKLINLGDTVTRASLLVQIFIIATFFLMAGILHRACHIGGINSRKVIRPSVMAYLSMLLILARTIYRVVEHFSVPPPINGNVTGFDTSSLRPSLRYEWYFYVFEATPLLIALVLWNVWHPRHYLPEDHRTYLAQDGVTLLKGPGWKDSRSLTQTFFDPFASLTARGGHNKPFWENNGYTLKRRRATGRA